VEAASPFAPTPQAPRPAPVIPPAKGGRAGMVLVLVLLAAGGVAGGAWWLGNRWKQKLSPPRRPPATATRPPEPKPEPKPESKPEAQPPVATAETTNPEAVPGTPDDPAKPEPEAQTEPAKPEPEAQTEPAKPEPEIAKPEPTKKPRPPVERKPSAGARSFARGMEHRERGEEDEAMYAFEEAIRQGGMDPEMRSEAERQYINIKRKYGFIDILCDERGIDVAIDNRSRGQTPFRRPLLVRPGPHQVVLSGGGYQSKRLTVDVGPAQKTAVKCRR
jgi:hypothetical protein